MPGTDGGGTPVRIRVGTPTPAATPSAPAAPLPTAGPVVVVQGPGPQHPLPFTGLDTVTLLLLGALLLALGAVLVLSGRTREARHP